MGSYVSTEKFFQLPIRGGKRHSIQQIFFTENESDEEIISTLTNSNLGRIQTTKEPTEDEINILNEGFRINPDIAFRHYNMFSKDADISYLLNQCFHEIVCTVDIVPEVCFELPQALDA